MNGMRIFRLLPALTGLLLLAGCSSTRLVTSWHDETYPSGALKKFLVVAISEKKVNRLKAEDEFARELRAAGVDALQSYTIFPEMENLSAETIKAKLPDTDRDAILVTRLVDVKKETVIVPGRTDVYPVGGYAGPGYYRSFGSYYAQSYSVVTTPGYSYESRSYILETNLYDAGTDKLVWTATTQTEDPGSFDRALADLVRVIMKELRTSKIF